MKTLGLLIASLAVLLPACGGDSPHTGNESPDTGSGLSLTSANAQTTAKVVYGAAMSSADLADVGSNIGVTANEPGSSAGATAQKQADGYLVNVLQQAPFGPDTLPCAVSGSITISGDIANPLTLTAGDTFSVDADACDDGLGEILDGLMNMTISEFSGDLFLGMYLLGMDATLDALQVTTPEDVISSTGDTTVVLDTTAAPFVSAAVSGASMTTSSNASTETLSDYATAQTVDAGRQSAPYTLNSSGTLDSSQLAGVVSFTTPVQFQGFGVDFPGSGELLISGNNSSARLIALDNVNVRIEIDNDGVAGVDETIETTWAELTDWASP